MGGRGSESKKQKTKKKNVLKHQLGFLLYLSSNKDSRQSKKFLRYLISKDQYKLLREIVDNYKANNIPVSGRLAVRLRELEAQNRSRLDRLARGQLKRANLPFLHRVLQLLASAVLEQYER
jgi:hypothetical protein